MPLKEGFNCSVCGQPYAYFVDANKCCPGLTAMENP